MFTPGEAVSLFLSLKLGQMLSIQDENMMPPQVRLSCLSASDRLGWLPLYCPCLGQMLSIQDENMMPPQVRP